MVETVDGRIMLARLEERLDGSMKLITQAVDGVREQHKEHHAALEKQIACSTVQCENSTKAIAEDLCKIREIVSAERIKSTADRVKTGVLWAGALSGIVHWIGKGIHFLVGSAT